MLYLFIFFKHKHQDQWSLFDFDRGFIAIKIHIPGQMSPPKLLTLWLLLNESAVMLRVCWMPLPPLWNGWSPEGVCSVRLAKSSNVCVCGRFIELNMVKIIFIFDVAQKGCVAVKQSYWYNQEVLSSSRNATREQRFCGWQSSSVRQIWPFWAVCCLLWCNCISIVSFL